MRHSSLVFGMVIVITALALYAAAHTHHGALISAAFTSIHQPVATAVAAEQASALCHMHGQLPDSTCTPGVIDASVTQANIQQTICASGYTASVRPPVAYTDRLKAQQMENYGFTDSERHHEEDHLIPLELGGSAADPRNLWPEPGNSPNPKDSVENFLRQAVCEGSLSLSDAQKRIASNWTTAEDGL